METTAEIAHVQCPLCGYTYSTGEMPERGCRLCPLHKNCDAFVCPNCGYCQPQTTRTELFLRRLFGWLGKKIRPSGGDAEASSVVRLSELRPMTWARVERVDATSAHTSARLGGFCILPGVVLQFLQRHPAYVVRVEETTVGLDRRLAESIWVSPLLPISLTVPPAAGAESLNGSAVEEMRPSARDNDGDNDR